MLILNTKNKIELLVDCLSNQNWYTTISKSTWNSHSQVFYKKAVLKILWGNSQQYSCNGGYYNPTQPAFTCLELTIKTLEQGVRYAQSYNKNIVNFEHI